MWQGGRVDGIDSFAHRSPLTVAFNSSPPNPLIALWCRFLLRQLA